jgi:hypothetical protein
LFPTKYKSAVNVGSAFAAGAASTEIPVPNKMAAVAIEINFLIMM